MATISDYLQANSASEITEKQVANPIRKSSDHAELTNLEIIF